MGEVCDVDEVAPAGVRGPSWEGGDDLLCDNQLATAARGRHGLEGLTHVTAALRAGDLTVGEIGVALVGGTHPDSEALSAASATWCVPEILPGATAAEALGAPQLLRVDGCRASCG